MKLKFIHAADLHLDSPFQGLSHLPEKEREIVMNATLSAFQHLVSDALEHEVDFVLLAGDIYDHPDRSIRAQLAFRTEVAKLAEAGIHVFIVHGNHDPLDGSQIRMDFPSGVHVFPADTVVSVPFYKHGQEAARIYGISYPTAKVTQNYARLFQRESEAFAIGLLHTNCESVSDHANYAPCTKQELLAANFDYWALGHVHHRQVLHEQPPIVYPGNMQGRHIREQGEKGYYFVEVEDHDHVRLTFRPAATLMWVEVEVDLQNVDSVAQLMDQLEEERGKLRHQFPWKYVIVRCRGVGETHLAGALSNVEVLKDLVEAWNTQEEGRRPFIWLESFQFDGHPVYDRHGLKKSGGVVADVLHLTEELTENEQKQDQFLSETLADVFAHPRAKKYVQHLPREEKQALLRQAESLLLTEWLGREEK